jgi:Flp pilus assembly protein TadD
MNVFGQSATELASQAAQAMQDRNYAEAEHLYAKLTHLAPDVPEIYSNLGLARYYQGQFNAAQQAFLAAHRLNAHLFVPNFFLGKAHFDHGRYSLALPLLEEAAKLQPGEKEPRRLIAATFVGLHREDEAIQQYQKLVGEDPRDIESMYGLALVYTDRGKSSLSNLLNYKNTCYAELARADLDTAKTQWETIAADEYRKAIAISPGLPGV